MSHFFAYLSRMKLIQRWALMQNVRTENVQEHSLQVALVGHALAVIGNKFFGKDYDPPRAKRMLETFSGYLRAGLSQMRATDSTLGAELDMARSYLALRRYEQARTEARTLSDQLRQARADLHRLGIADQNRGLVCAAVSGALGILVGLGLGLSMRRRGPP